MDELTQKLFRFAPDDAGAGEGQGDPEPADDDTNDDGDGETPEDIEFETWLAEQSEAVRAAYAEHTGGLTSALQSERERRKELEKERKAKEREADKAEAKRLEEAGEFKELAEKAQKKAEDAEAKLSEFEPQIETLTAERDRYAKALKSYVDKAREGVPEHLTPLLDKLDPVEQLEYLTENADKLALPSTGSPTNNPRRGVSHNLSDDEKRRRSYQVQGL